MIIWAAFERLSVSHWILEIEIHITVIEIMIITGHARSMDWTETWRHDGCRNITGVRALVWVMPMSHLTGIHFVHVAMDIHFWRDKLWLIFCSLFAWGRFICWPTPFFDTAPYSMTEVERGTRNADILYTESFKETVGSDQNENIVLSCDNSHVK